MTPERSHSFPKFDPKALRLYAITPDGGLFDPDLKAKIRAWLEGGVRTIQFRQKRHVRLDQLLQFGRYLRAITSEYRALLIVNDDPRLAKLLKADGCHLGQDDVGVEVARRILGPGKIIGLSTHSRSHAFAAVRQDVDYLAVGPIYETATKKSKNAPLGPEFAGWASRRFDLPVIAIGGITLENVGAIATAGCTNVAVVSALNDDPAPRVAARSFIEKLSAFDSVERL